MRFQKMGRIFDPRDHQRWWLHEFAQATATLLLDDRLRIYFSGRPAPDADGNYVSFTGFADFDRWDLTKLIRVSDEPIMPLGGLGAFDEFGTYPVSMIGDRCYYAGWNRGSARFDTAIGLAISDDGGETFKRVGHGGPVLGASLYEPFVLSGPKIRFFDGQYWLFYIAGKEWRMCKGRAEPIYKIRCATSRDGFHFNPLNVSLITGPKDEVQSGPDVHYSDGRYHMYFCFRNFGHHPGREGGLRIGYASCMDLNDGWTRDDAQAGIDLDPDPNAWDGQHIRYPHWFEMDGVEYLVYNGNEFGRYGFGLARRIK